jgi:hypothetical protein
VLHRKFKATWQDPVTDKQNTNVPQLFVVSFFFLSFFFFFFFFGGGEAEELDSSQNYYSI